MNLGLLNPPLSARDHIKGLDSAPLVLVEYGDFECPHCGRASAVVDELTKELGDRLRFGFRHFPLAKMHPHARKAAMATEAAGAQGGAEKFWALHDLLFANPGKLTVADLLGYAGQLQLDVARFEAELTNDTYAPRVQEDVASGVRSGVNGTPTFFINGVRHNGGYAIESLREGLLPGG